MKPSTRPMWKKSMLQGLYYDKIRDDLWTMADNGDMYGYERDADCYPDDQGYYQEYKQLFDDISAGAYRLGEALDAFDVSENWDDMTVALLGETHKVLGYNDMEEDYYGMLGHAEDWAVQEATKRICRLTKPEMVKCFRRVLVALMCYADLKAAHDCLTSIVEELDERSAILSRMNDGIDRLYKDYNLASKNDIDFDRLIASVPPRMWVE